MRFARLVRTWCSRRRTSRQVRQSQRADLVKRAGSGVSAGQRGRPDLVDLLADPGIVGTEKR